MRRSWLIAALACLTIVGVAYALGLTEIGEALAQCGSRARC